MVELYEIGLAVAGLIVLGAAVLPRLLAGRAISFPILYVAFGMAVFSVPNGLPTVDPIEYGVLAERLTELGVIVALMGAGLKLDRPPTLSGWMSTWRLLAISMPLAIAAAAILGWWAIGLALDRGAVSFVGFVVSPHSQSGVTYATTGVAVIPWTTIDVSTTAPTIAQTSSASAKVASLRP